MSEGAGVVGELVGPVWSGFRIRFGSTGPCRRRGDGAGAEEGPADAHGALGVVVGTDVVGDGLEAVPAGVADAALQREAAEGRRGLPGARGSGGGPRRVRRGTQSKRGRRERG